MINGAFLSQAAASFKLLKIIFNRKRGKSAQERALLFLTGAALGMRQEGWARLEVARLWGQPMVGGFSPSCPMPGQHGGLKNDVKPPCAACLLPGLGKRVEVAAGTLPRDCFGAEWTAAGVFRGLETLPLHYAQCGGREGSPLHCAGWDLRVLGHLLGLAVLVVAITWPLC